ncbi:FAD-dependent monooxygenase [Gordonia soli]|uniref:Putative monooxygenase n=1 Tax=Gordonia soli NBRC 108243 TaxID=1223545 RepID=M0QM24_9ACTN|nr:FAD-dependent monooxygenase [Gordonia soli]GAC69720.1 putative monooxygenase [Gordonia soli NBRC 108243]
MTDIDVLVAGAGPIGLAAAVELRRRGVRVRIVDPLSEPPLYAKAVGVQPRTLEVFEGMGVLGEILAAGVEMRGQVVYVNGDEVSRIDLVLPEEIPFRFLAIPQYETERVLRERLAELDTTIERGIAVSGFTHDDSGVTVTLTGHDDAGRESEAQVRAAYLIGADGAHSIVRKTLGLTFEGGALADQYMLGDVEVDWSVPAGYGVRSMHRGENGVDDLLVCIPLPGHGRYRMSMLVPPDLSSAPDAGGDGITHGFEGACAPELSHIQAVLDRLSPEPTTARNLRWSSVFRISHRIVDAYSRGRVFVAGDAAHIHPPTGAQGMNTGIQDAHNLAWKIGLAVGGFAAEGLLDSYDAERRPVGEEVVGRTVRSAKDGIGADITDPTQIVLREAQLLIDYTASPIVSPASGDGVQPGHRAPDATGLRRDVVNGPTRLFAHLDRRRHSALVYTDTSGAAEISVLESLAERLRDLMHDQVQVHLVVADGIDVGQTTLSILRDQDGEFARSYSPQGNSLFLIRPDGYLGHRGTTADAQAVEAYVRTVFS